MAIIHIGEEMLEEHVFNVHHFKRRKNMTSGINWMLASLLV
jgi:hypothetical protein